MAARKRSFVVIGLGTFGGTVAVELARFGNHVLGIDNDERVASRFSDELTEVVIADGRDEEALREAGVGTYDVAVVAIGEDLESNVLCTMNVKMLGAPTVWAKAIGRTHHRILAKLDIDRVIQAEHDIGLHIAQMLHNPLVRDYVSLGNGFHIVDFQVPEALEGRTVDTLALQDSYELRGLGLMRGTEFIEAERAGGTALEAGDKLLLLGVREKLRAFADSVS